MFLNAISRRFVKSGISPGCSMTIEITAWIWIVYMVTTVVTAQNFYTNGRYGKRQDPGQGFSFWSGSRYGRSGGAVPNDLPKNDADDETSVKDVEVSPRIDRFFLGSRYGKRTFSNDQRTDSLKHFETSLDFLISVDHQTTEKEQLEVLTQELKNNENFVTLRSTPENRSTLVKNEGSKQGFACLYTGVTNLYRCFRRRTNGTQELMN
ncbi:uncharacterized protein LOC105683582 [Athalia rosae]|uniref:uncharacterized protein LOC105683582 n=1 Tax=Athalia rosae TaxID=37344 RepID=UPI0006252550|nr:uncharacterized protein LOC105683582 [Athalia rosae]XP_048515068.1 uncharacterized protein LOC105683582 [Athalia rosae]XP_048515069.1 uncharacterized protein LOC105683582 [Athalia rosae]